jgi:RNA polymerase sigma-70 factor (ECF subfamily)
MRSKTDIEGAIDAHGDTVWRVCVLYFKYHADAQDAFQETLLKYSTSEVAFNDEEHRKAWLIRVATNVCKDMYKAAHRRNVPIEDEAAIEGIGSSAGSVESSSATSEVLAAIRSLSDPPRTPVYLALYEGYSAPEISKLLDAPVNTVYSWIARGKQQLREALQ